MVSPWPDEKVTMGREPWFDSESSEPKLTGELTTVSYEPAMLYSMQAPAEMILQEKGD